VLLFEIFEKQKGMRFQMYSVYLGFEILIFPTPIEVNSMDAQTLTRVALTLTSESGLGFKSCVYIFEK